MNHETGGKMNVGYALHTYSHIQIELFLEYKKRLFYILFPL